MERLRRHSTCDSLKTNPLSRNAIVQLLTAAITFKHRQHLVSGAIEDAVDGVLDARHVDGHLRHVYHLVGRVRSG